MVAPRRRRRVVRKSDAVDYDRQADRGTTFVSAYDDERAVILDPDQDEEPTGLKFYKDQMPPHYGQ